MKVGGMETKLYGAKHPASAQLKHVADVMEDFTDEEIRTWESRQRERRRGYVELLRRKGRRV